MLRIALFTETFLPKVDCIVNTLCHLLDHLAAREHASLLFAPQGALKRYAQTTVVTLPAAPWPAYPEFKVDGSARRRYGGSGLSVALVKEIVQSHGGQVALESEPEQYSTFTIAFPVAEEG